MALSELRPIEPSKAFVDWAIENTPERPPASDDDALARKAVAEISKEDGWDRHAQFALSGAFDEDPEHRIALAAIRLFREQGKTTGFCEFGGEE